MFVNLQISTPKFRNIVRDHVQTAVLTNRELGLAGIRNIPFDSLDPSAATEPGVVDHIEIENIHFKNLRGEDVDLDTITLNLPPLMGVGLLSSIPRTATLEILPLRAMCDIGVFCIRVADLEASGLAPVPATRVKRFGLQAVLAVSQPVIEAGILSLAFAPDEIRLGTGQITVPADEHSNPDVRDLAADIMQIMVDNAAEWFPPVKFPVDNLNEALGERLTIWNAGLRIDGNIVDLQLQIEPKDMMVSVFFLTSGAAPNWEQLWRSYYTEALTDQLGSDGLDWGIYFPFELFEGRIAETVETSLEPRDDVVLNETPTSTWTVTGGVPTGSCFPGGQGHIDTDIAVHLPGACEPWGYVMDVNVQLATSLSFPRPGVIRLDLVASHEVDPGDIFVCGSLNAFLGGSGGFFLGGLIGGGIIGSVVVGILASIFGGFGTLGYILDYDFPSLEAETIEPVEGEDNAYFSEIEIDDTIDEVLGTLRVTQLVPCRDGLMAGGSLTRTESIFLALPAGSLAVPRWRQPGRPECLEEDEHADIIAEIGFHFIRDIRAKAIPLVLWGVENLAEDPEHGWPDPIFYLGSAAIACRYQFSQAELERIRDNAAGEQPVLKILFQCNAGARIFELPVPEDSLTEAELAAVADEIEERCSANQELIDSFEERTHHLRDILRGPMPFLGDIDFDAVRWSAAFVGLRPHTLVELAALIDNQVQHVAETELDLQGAGKLEFWQTGAFSQAEMLLQINGSGDQHRADQSGFIVASRRYRIMDEVPLSGQFHDQAIVENRYGVFTAVLTSNRLLSYRLGSTGKLFISNGRRADGILGVTAHAGSLYAWSESDLWINRDGASWQHVTERPSNRIGHFKRKLAPRVSHKRAHHHRRKQSVEKFVKHNASSSAATSRKYALVLGEEEERLHFMEFIDIAVGGYLEQET